MSNALAARHAARRRSLRGHPLAQLTLVRDSRVLARARSGVLGDFLPDPAVGRSRRRLSRRPGRGPERGDHVAGAGAARCAAEAGLDVSSSRRGRGSRRCAAAGWRCSRCRPTMAARSFRYDDTNPEGRTARMLADRAVQRAAGRSDPVRASDDLVREPGSRYIDFLVPGLVGLGIMSNAIWGIGFSIVDCAPPQADQAADRHADVAHLLPDVLSDLADDRAGASRSGCRSGFGALAFGVPVRGRLIDLALDLRARIALRSARWAC